MDHRDKKIYPMLKKLMQLASYLLDHGGTFGHAQEETQYQALWEAFRQAEPSPLADEFKHLHTATERVLAAESGMHEMAGLQAARDHTEQLLASDEYSPRAPMNSGFTD